MKCALQIRKDASSGLGGVTHMHCIFLQGIGQVLYLLNAFDHLEQVQVGSVPQSSSRQRSTLGSSARLEKTASTSTDDWSTAGAVVGPEGRRIHSVPQAETQRRIISHIIIYHGPHHMSHVRLNCLSKGACLSSGASASWQSRERSDTLFCFVLVCVAFHYYALFCFCFFLHISRLPATIASHRPALLLLCFALL